MAKDKIPLNNRDIAAMARRDSTTPDRKLAAIIAARHRDEEKRRREASWRTFRVIQGY